MRLKQIYMRKRMQQIRHHLAPVLENMGIKAYLGTKAGCYYVEFETPEGRSPLALAFPPNPDGGRPSWSEAFTEYTDQRFEKLGKTGWKHRREWGQICLPLVREGEGPVDLEELFSVIAHKLRHYGITPFERVEKELKSQTLADIFWAVGNDIPDLAVVRIPMEDHEFPDEDWAKWDALTFMDHEGRRIHICHAQGYQRGPIYADGEKIGEVNATHPHYYSASAKLAYRLAHGQVSDKLLIVTDIC